MSRSGWTSATQSMNEERKPCTVYPRAIFSRRSTCIASSVWRPEPPRRRLPNMSVSGATSSGLIPANKSTAAEVSGIVRAWPDFICDPGTCHLSPSISPQVAGMTSPVLGQHVSNKNSSALCRWPLALPQFREEGRQIPPWHCLPRLHVHGHAGQVPQDVVAGIGAAEPTGIDGHGVLDRLFDTAQDASCGFIGGVPGRLDDAHHVGLRQTHRGLVHQRDRQADPRTAATPSDGPTSTGRACGRGT